MVSVNISSSADDVKEVAGKLDDTDCTAGYDDDFGGLTATVGLRFQNVGLANAASLATGKLTVNVTGVTGSPSLLVYGVDVDDLAVWADPGNMPDSATKTTASTAWAPTGTGSAEIDVKAIVQEIIDRGGWASGQDLGFVIVDNVGSGDNFVSFEDYSAAGTNEAQLDVTYTVAATSTAYPSMNPGGRKHFRMVSR